MSEWGLSNTQIFSRKDQGTADSTLACHLGAIVNIKIITKGDNKNVKVGTK